MVKIHRKFCSVNGLGIGICSAVSKHYICLCLSTGLKGEESGSKPKWLYLEDTSDKIHCFAYSCIYNVMWIADKFLHETSRLSRYLKVLDTFKGTSSRIIFCVYSFLNWRNTVCRNRIVNPPLRTVYRLFSGLRRWEGRNCKKIPLVC